MEAVVLALSYNTSYYEFLSIFRIAVLRSLECHS